MSEKDIEERIVRKCVESPEYMAATHIATQVYVDGKRIDIVRVRKDQSCVDSIEVKIKDWRSALRQAMLNKHLTDRSFVAISMQYSKPALSNLELFIENGVGLMIIDADFHLQTIYQPSIDEIQYEEYDARNYTIKRALAA